MGDDGLGADHFLHEAYGKYRRVIGLSRKERCESGRIGLTANELTWVTGSEGSNPSLSARVMSLDIVDTRIFTITRGITCGITRP